MAGLPNTQGGLAAAGWWHGYHHHPPAGQQPGHRGPGSTHTYPVYAAVPPRPGPHGGGSRRRRARYLDVDVTVVRIILAVLTVAGGAGVPVYLAGWLLIPDEGATQSIASEFIQSLSARSR